MTRSRLGVPGLLLRHLRGGGAVSLLLPLLVGVSALAIGLAPRALAEVSSAELQHELTDQSPLLLDLTGSGRLGIPINTPDLTMQFLVGTSDSAISNARNSMLEPLLGATEPAQWVVRTNAATATRPNQRVEPSINLALDLTWQERVEIVEGSAPTEWAAGQPEAGTNPIEVAISRASADAMDVRVGDGLGFQPASLVVAAIYEPLDAEDAYWVHVSDLAAPVEENPPGRLPIVHASVYVAPESIAGLSNEFALGELRAWIPIDPAPITSANAAEIQDQILQFATRTTELPFGGELDFRSGIADLIERVTVRVAAMSALLALSVSGLAGVLFAVVALGVRSVLARRAPALRLAASRGGSELQLRGAMVLEALVLSLPAGLLGAMLAAIILPSEVGIVTSMMPAAVAIIPALLFGVLTSARPVERRRTEQAGPFATRARPIAELAVVGLAVLALVLLARRGLVGPSAAVGIDPLLSATPLLLAVAACLGALRLFPLTLRALQRSVRRRGDAASVFGVARAVRDPALGFATALALVVGVSVVVFSTVMSGTVRAGLIDGAADEVGADARIEASAIEGPTVEKVRALGDVDAVVALSTGSSVPFVDPVNDRSATVVVADSAALHAVRSDIPVLPEADGRTPVLISSDWANRAVGFEATLGDAPVVVAGIVDVLALPQLGGEWVLVDAAAAGALGVEIDAPDSILIRFDAGVDLPQSARRAAQIVSEGQPVSQRRSVVATDLSTAIAESRTPVVRGLDGALLTAALASLALMMATIVLATAAAAARRNKLIGILRVIGMSAPQLRRVQAWELGPLAAVAMVVGTVLGLALPVLVTSVLDLRPFIGGSAMPRAVVEPLPVLLVLGAFALMVIIAALLALALGRRLAPAAILKMGDS